MNGKLLDEILAQVKRSKKTTEKEKKIVASATSLFAEKGFANTSTSEIARLSGVAEATIFRHYGTKENLLLAIVIPFLKEFIPVMTDELFTTLKPKEHSSFASFLKSFLLNRIRFVEENKEIFIVFFKEFVYREDIRAQFLPYFKEYGLPRMYDVIDYFKKKGQLKDMANEQVMQVILPNFIGYVLTKVVLFPDSVRNDQEGVDQIIDCVMNGIAGGG